MLEVISTLRALHSFRHRPLALLWIRVLAAPLHKRPHSGARNWVVWLFDTAQHGPGSRCTVSTMMLLSDADFRSLGSNERLSGVKYWEEISVSKDKVAMGRSLTGSSLLGSVCMSCFVIPANWPSLHPTLPYQGTARRGKQTIVVDGTLW